MFAKMGIQLPKPWPRYSTLAIERATNLIRDGRVYSFGDDETIIELEEWAKKYFATKYALCLNSGTAALASAYAALNLQPGDEVLVPTYTFHATATPLLNFGVRPIMYDCQESSTAVDIQNLKERVTSRTRAIVVSHMFGFMGNLAEVLRYAKKLGLPLIEDASQAHGAFNHLGLAGTIGDVGCFSLGGQKMISGGFGGLLITNSQRIYEEALIYGHSHERSLQHITPENSYFRSPDVGGGTNLRMHPVAAALALDHAKTLDERINVRVAMLNRLSEGLSQSNYLDVPTQAAGVSRGGWYGYKVVIKSQFSEQVDTNQLAHRLWGAGLKVAVPTTKPLHETSLGEKDPDRHCPHASSLYARTLSFPDKHFHEWCPTVIDQYIETTLGVLNTWKI